MRSTLLFFVIMAFALGTNAQPWLQAPYLTINGPSDSFKLRNFYEIQKAFNLYEKDQEEILEKKEERERWEKAIKSPITLISKLIGGRREKENIKEKNEKNRPGHVARANEPQAASVKAAKENQAEDEEESEGKFPGYALYKRWENYMEPRVFPSGDITLPSNKSVEFKKYKNNMPHRAFRPGHSADLPVYSCSFTGNWTALGPTRYMLK